MAKNKPTKPSDLETEEAKKLEAEKLAKEQAEADEAAKQAALLAQQQADEADEAAEQQRLADEQAEQQRLADEEAQRKADETALEASKAALLDEADKAGLTAFGGSAVAKAIAEQLKVSVDDLKTNSSDAKHCAARLGAMMRIFRNIAVLPNGSDFIACMDVLVALIKEESATGGVFSPERAHQHTANAPVPMAHIEGYQTMVNWISVMVNHLDNDSGVDYVKDFSEEALQIAFPGETGERMVGYGRRLCNVQ